MAVHDTDGERRQLGQVALDDIAAVIANAHGLSYTNNLLVAWLNVAHRLCLRRQPHGRWHALAH